VSSLSHRLAHEKVSNFGAKLQNIYELKEIKINIYFQWANVHIHWATLHVPIHLWTTVDPSGPVWLVCRGTEITDRPTASDLALNCWVRFSTTQRWSCNRLSSSAKSSSLEHACGNGTGQATRWWWWWWNIHWYVKFTLTFHTLTKILRKMVLHVKMQKNHKVFSPLSAALTSVQLKLCWIGRWSTVLFCGCC